MKRPRSFQFDTIEPESKRAKFAKQTRRPAKWTSPWLELDRPDLEPSHTYPIDEKFQRRALESKACQDDQECAFISKNIRHVSFDQFMAALDRSIDKLIDSGALDKPFALTSPDIVSCSSGMWVMELILDRTRIGTDPRYHPAAVKHPSETHEEFMTHVTNQGIHTLVLVDDAAYSGMQMVEIDKFFLSKSINNIEIVLPFVTEQALDVIHNAYKLKGGRVWFDEIIPTGPTSRNRKGRTALYFDHKMADDISTYPKVRNWISGCQSNKECPVPPYKHTKSCVGRHRRSMFEGPRRDQDQLAQDEFFKDLDWWFMIQNAMKGANSQLMNE